MTSRAILDSLCFWESCQSGKTGNPSSSESKCTGNIDISSLGSCLPPFLSSDRLWSRSWHICTHATIYFPCQMMTWIKLMWDGQNIISVTNFFYIISSSNEQHFGNIYHQLSCTIRNLEEIMFSIGWHIIRSQEWFETQCKYLFNLLKWNNNKDQAETIMMTRI